MGSDDLGHIDPLQTWYLAKAEQEGTVFRQAVQRLVRRLYRDRDYLARRKSQGKQTTYDMSTEQDMLAIAWAIAALVRFVPDDLQVLPLPERPPRAPRPRRQAKATYSPPQRVGWEGPDLPPGDLLTRRPSS